MQPAAAHDQTPRLLVFSSLFPTPLAPAAGVFIRERMFRVAKELPLVVVSPQPWSPLDALIRLARPTFRRPAPAFEVMDGIEVHRPRVLSIPGVLKRLDGHLMAMGAMRTVAALVKRHRINLIDAHFLYPDGFAATRIARRLDLPVTITLRGSKDTSLLGTDREPYLRQAMQSASHVFAVSEALREDLSARLGTVPSKVTTIGNGVDLAKFHVTDRIEARRRLGLPATAKVLISVGGLIEHKGFHRVIPLLPALRERHPGLVYLIVGGGVTQGDMTERLKALALEHGVADVVRLCGPQAPEDLKWFYGAADVFTLATAYEGWANVFLEAMACGLPVISTRVGGNPEVVSAPALGELGPYWDAEHFRDMLDRALSHAWDREAIVAYAQANSWASRITQLVDAFRRITNASPAAVTRSR